MTWEGLTFAEARRDWLCEGIVLAGLPRAKKCVTHISLDAGLACYGGAPIFSQDFHLEADVATATGFDFQPLDDGPVLIEFFGVVGKTFNKQVVTADVMKNMALVSVLTDVALRKGPQIAQEIMRKVVGGTREVRKAL